MNQFSIFSYEIKKKVKVPFCASREYGKRLLSILSNQHLKLFENFSFFFSSEFFEVLNAEILLTELHFQNKNFFSFSFWLY